MKKHSDFEHTAEPEHEPPTGSEGSISPDETTAPAADLQSECDRLRDDCAQWQDKYLRKLAEFDNYRKRTRQESEMLRQMVAESLLTSLLPIMDDFERMLNAPADSNDALRKGVELIRGKFWTFFEAQGVTKFAAPGEEFNPNLHDALLSQPTADFPPHTILNVVACGYKIGDRVLRHAHVIVSTEMNTESPTGDNDSAQQSTLNPSEE
jgi:molecular chaperone GrpE